MNDNDDLDFSLSAKDSRASELFLDPMDRTFGDDIEIGKIRIRLGRRPTAYPLTELYEKAGRDIPDEYTLYLAYDVWIINMSLGIMSEGGWKSIKQVGCQIKYADSPKVNILDMIPQTEFIQKASGSYVSNTSVSLTGEVAVDTSMLDAGALQNIANAGFEVNSSNQASLAANLKCSVMTPTVITIGVGDTRGEWLFKKHDKPLLGDQHFVHTLLVPAGLKQLELKAKVFANVSGFASLPVRLESNWETLELDLEN